MNVEVTRTRYRPDRITTLFVGESAPASGAFFYYGNSALTRHMETAMTANGLGGSGDFLERFKAYGWVSRRSRADACRSPTKGRTRGTMYRRDEQPCGQNCRILSARDCFAPDYEEEGGIVFREACKLGCEGIVSKRFGSPYRSGRWPHWVKVKNPEAPAVKREAEEDCGR
jgi:hypothetical protein